MKRRRKICRTCKAEKSLRQFYRHPTYADGHMNDCKECKKAYQREMHWLKRDAVLQRQRAYSRTERSREARRRYAQTSRGVAIQREARKTYRILKRMEARAA